MAKQARNLYTKKIVRLAFNETEITKAEAAVAIAGNRGRFHFYPIPGGADSPNF